MAGEIGRLTSLRVLDLSYTQVSELPDSLASLAGSVTLLPDTARGGAGGLD